MLLIAGIIGFLAGTYAVYTVVFVYKFKGTPKAGIVRVLGVSSVAIVASFGNYLLTYVFYDEETSLVDGIAFSLTGILSMAFFFWLNRDKIK